MKEKEKLPCSIYEKEVNLLDLLWELIYSWRAIIICSIVFACLFAGLKYMADSRGNAGNEDDTMKNLWMGLSESETLQLERAIVENESIENQLKSNMEYQRDSILMNLDPYHENQVILQYYIDSHYAFSINESISKDYTQSLLFSYMTYITNGQITKECAEKLNVEDNGYLAELIQVSPDLETDEPVLYNSTFCISVAGKDLEQAKVIAEVIQGALEEYQSELSSKIGSHDLVLIDDYEQVVQDKELAQRQAEVETTIYNLKLQQENMKSKLSAQQQQLLEYEQGAAAESDEKSVTVKAGINKKYMVLGFLLGAFFVCVVIAFRYIFNTNLKNEKELQEIYGLRIFGTIDALDQSKKLFSFIDRWLDRISGKQKGNKQEQLEITAANLLIACKKFKWEKVFFTASVHLTGDERKLVDQLLGQLKKEGIETVYEENMMQNIKALKGMSETGQVVLVERTKQTKYQALEEELLLCREQEAEIIGVVALR